MKVSAYNPSNGSLIADAITGITFGNVKQGKHNAVPIVIKPFKTVETQFTEMKIFLENDGGFTQSNFGEFLTDNFITGIAGGSNYLSDNFIRVPGATLLSTGGIDLDLVSGVPTQFIWLDVQIGSTETGSTSTINYRFAFEFS